MKLTISCFVVFGLTVTVLLAEAPLAKLQVDPPQVNLTTAKDRQLLAVQATYADGLTRDVAAQASYLLTNPALIRRDGQTLYPVADGQTELKVEFGGQAVTIPVKIEKMAEVRPISF